VDKIDWEAFKMNIKHHWKKRLAMALSGGFLVLHTAVVGASPMELSLEDSIAMALDNNPTIKVAEMTKDSAVLATEVAKGAKGPSVSLTHTDAYGKLSTLSYKTGGGFQNVATASINLYTGGLVESNIATAKLNLKVADLGVEQSKQQIKLNATTAYFTILQAQNAVQVDQETVDQMTVHLGNVQAQYAVGTVAKTDVLASQVTLANDQQTLMKAKNSYDVAVASLNSIIGLPLYTEVTLKDSLQHDPYTMSFEDSIQYAMQHRPEAIQAGYNIQIAEEAVKAAKAGLAPTVTASTSATWLDTDFPGMKDATDPYSWSATLVTTWTPFDSGVSKNKIKKSDTGVLSAKETAKQTKNTIELAVRQAYLNMSEAEKRIDTSLVTVDQAEENLKIAQVRYSAGVGTNTDVIDAQVAVTTAKMNYIQALYDYNTGKSNLEQAIGMPASGK